MRLALIIFFSVQVSVLSFSQLALDLTTGFGMMYREVPEGHLEGRINSSLSVNATYSFKSVPLNINCTSYLISRSQYEQSFANNFNQIQANYYPRVVLMCGVGSSFKPNDFIQLLASVQIGYWYTLNTNTIYITSVGFIHTENNLHQFAVGPTLGMTLGKKQLKYILRYEDYFLLPSTSLWNSGERFSRISMGISYEFKRSD